MLKSKLATGRLIPTLSLALALLLLLFACASEPPKQSKRPAMKANKLFIFNKTDSVINQVRFKLCGTAAGQFTALDEVIKPKEKVTIGVYGTCVDLEASNAFGSIIAETKNFRLDRDATWTVEMAQK